MPGLVKQRTRWGGDSVRDPRLRRLGALGECVWGLRAGIMAPEMLVAEVWRSVSSSPSKSARLGSPSSCVGVAAP